MAKKNPNTGTFKATKKSGTVTRLINTPILQDLGYRLTTDGYENRKSQVRVMRLERMEDGTTPPFAVCMHLWKDIGFILPEPFTYYRENIQRRMTAQEVQ